MKKMKNNTTSNPEMVTISRAEYDEMQSLKEQNAELSGKVEYLMEQMRLARAKRFGASSERASEEVMEQLSCLFDEAEVYAAEEQKDETPTQEVKAHKRKKSGSVKDTR